MDERQRLLALRVVSMITTLVFAWWVISFALPAYHEGLLFLSRRFFVKFVLGIGVCIFSLAILAVSFTQKHKQLFDLLSQGEAWLSRYKYLDFLVFLLLVVGVSIFLMSPSGLPYKGKASRLLFFWVTTLLGSFLLLAGGIRQRWIVLLGNSAVTTAFGFRLAAYIPDVSKYPLTLSWSEASRYYYASLFFAKKIYGQAIPPTILHPTRYLLQSIPFLLPNSSLWQHRLWQVLLWIGITLIFSIVIANRLGWRERFIKFSVVAWTFLYLLIGPVYYHLQVPALLIVWGFYPKQDDRKSRVISLICLGLASIWAGISRVNWYPVPGLLAAALYFIEVNRQGKSIWRYLLPPAVWTIGGTAIAVASQAAYIKISGNPADQFASSFTSNLLWYRLFPNPTYSLGILGAAIFVSLPLVLLALTRLTKLWRRIHIIRWLGLFAILLVLFVGGLVVSVKIGGGSNLHNMDAYLVVLLMICGMIYSNHLSPDYSDSDIAQDESLHNSTSILQRYRWVWLGYLILMPILFTIFSGGALTYPDKELVETSLDKIRRQVQKASREGEVLFISERQLLIFGEIPGVKLVPEYERVFLMEMAMSGNADYLERFHQDLKNQRFSMIISEPVFLPIKGYTEHFGEENNAWVNSVGVNLRCYYTAIKTVKDLKVQLLVPQHKINKKCN